MDRKEAIEIVRKNYPHVGFSGSEFETALRELVPEFKEQPDPRHSLIEFIKWSCDRGSITPEQRENVDFWLAYLEKQKELAVIPDELVKNYKLFCEHGGRELASLINAINGFNKQKEQKPEEWSEGEEKMWVHDDDLFLDTAKMIVEDSPRKSYGGINKKSIVPWFYSLRERLKSLRPQPHWRPSEEQMKALNEIINTLAVSKHPHENDYLFNILNGLRKNLKSL